jgi:hypothetical protein
MMLLLIQEGLKLDMPDRLVVFRSMAQEERVSTLILIGEAVIERAYGLVTLSSAAALGGNRKVH